MNYKLLLWLTCVIYVHFFSKENLFVFGFIELHSNPLQPTLGQSDQLHATLTHSTPF